MARSRDWLARFRPAGSPGSPARPGVPADVSQADRELAAIFELLQPVEQECARIRAEAEREAGSRRDAAARSAAQLLASAAARSPEAQAEAFALVAARSRVQRERAEAELAATRVLDSAQERMPAVVAAVRRVLLTQLTSISGVDFPAPAGDLSDAAR